MQIRKDCEPFFIVDVETQDHKSFVMATPEALIEIWTLYAFGSLFIFLRVFSRTKLVGIRGYRLDDYLVWFAWVIL